MFRVPRSTYRLQFNAGFTFADATKIAGYLAELGISDVYASPILRARKGSTHGYDVVDATVLNPELGSDDDFNALHEELDHNSLGFLLDIVPNHMAASAENAWWMSVLENGQRSRYLHYFDIDWSPVTAQGKTVTKVLLPILGRPYGEAVEAQEIKLGFDRDGFFFQYYEHRLPLAPESYRMVLRDCIDSLPKEGVAIELRELVEGDEVVANSKFLKETIWRIYEQDEPFRDALGRAVETLNGEAGHSESFNALDALLDAQWYRLAYWRIASEKINYRRFFDVTDLVGVRVENPEVFEARNRRILDLIAEGKVTGLRIDHIDGLYDPIGHMRKLQLRLTDSGRRNEEAGGQRPEAGSEQPPSDLPFYIVVEKILADDEHLPKEFPVSGTTGYDFLSAMNDVFVDTAGLKQLNDFYRSFTGIIQSFLDIVYEKKKQIISELFPGEMRALGKQLSSLSLLDRNARDFPPSELLAALTEITACMRVYRTYIRDFEVSEQDRRSIGEAVEHARRRAPSTLDQRLFDFLSRMLCLELPSYAAEQRENWLSFVMRWQQFTGRVMAKGVEDTAFYNHNVLMSLNEVGGEPGRTDFDGLEEFHRRNERIAADWPDTLNASSTHDTKRSEDARARLNALSELAGDWAATVSRWTEMNAPLRVDDVPDRNVELLIYQNLLGMWPVDAEERSTVPERFKAFLEKAAREAKTTTSWIAPDTAYERSLLAFGDRILASSDFLESFTAFQRRLGFAGFLNSIAQVVLKTTSPGVPDFYQGTELWDFSLVDPDNRRPVDYEARISMLKKLKTADGRGALDRGTMLRRWFDGRIKLFVSWKALDVRARNANVFMRGGYRALRSTPNVCAYMRGDSIVVAVPRLMARMTDPAQVPVGDVWGDHGLDVSGSWRNAFTGETLTGDSLLLRDVFATFPVAILERG